MKALTVEGINRISLKDVPLRELEDDEVLCRVMYSGICGTDLAVFSGETSFVRDGLIKYPVRIGHEWSGRVERVGAAVDAFSVGDRVVSDSGIACGKCELCAQGVYAKCPDIKSIGTINCWDGSFAEYIIIPQRHLYRLPDEISYQAGALIEPLTVSFAAVSKYPIDKDTVVAVIGTGPIGMAAAALAAKMNAKKVIVVGRTDSKLHAARALGATDTVNIRTIDASEEIKRITGGRGVDFVCETSGAEDAAKLAVEIAAQHGYVALVGFYESPLNDFMLNHAVAKQLTLRGIMGEFGVVPRIIDYMLLSGLDLMPTVTRIIDFDSAPAYFMNHETERKKDIKVLVNISDREGE